MPDASQWTLFIVAAIVLLITPGPAVLYVVTRSLDQGRRAGLVSVAGIGLGTLAHVTAATLGISALLASSAAAFGVVKWAGAAYLVWLGLQRMLKRDREEGEGRTIRPQPQHGPWQTFWQGFVVNLLNPKTALFFLAFLPQFVNAAQPVAPQMLALGLCFTGLGLLSDGLFALLAGTVRRRVLTGQRAAGLLKAQRYLTGGVFIALGLTAALTRRAT